MRRHYLFFPIAVWTLVASSGAFADAPQGSGSSAPADASAKPPSAVPLGSQSKVIYGPKVLKGHSAYAARDFPGAIAAYKDAIKDEAMDPFAPYFLGEAELASGNMAEADASYTSALRIVGARDDLHAKILFVIADLRERQGRWADAKKAWDDYAQFLVAHPTVNGYAATATERTKVIDTHVDLETKYAAVKQRIEQRLKETTAPPSDDGPQGPTKKK